MPITRLLSQLNYTNTLQSNTIMNTSEIFRLKNNIHLLKIASTPLTKFDRVLIIDLVKTETAKDEHFNKKLNEIERNYGT